MLNKKKEKEKEKNIYIYIYISFARMESACVFSFGLLFLIKSVSNIKQSSLPRHFLRTLKFFKVSPQF